MAEQTKLLVYAFGGTFVVLLLYAIGDYVVIGLIGAGAIYIYQLITTPNDRNRRP